MYKGVPLSEKILLELPELFRVYPVAFRAEHASALLSATGLIYGWLPNDTIELFRQ